MESSESFNPPPSVGPTSTVEISVSCRELLNKDIASKSDPLCVIYHRPPGSIKFLELMRTEAIQDDLDPDFSTKLIIDYRFEEVQPLRFEIYDVDSESTDLAEHDFIGSLETTLSQIVAAGAKGLKCPLAINPVVDSDKDEAGQIILLSEELGNLKDEVVLKFGASGLTTQGCLFVQPKIFFKISKVNDLGNYVLVYRSDLIIGKELTWPNAVVPIRTLCNGEKERKLRVDFIQVGFRGKQKLVGYCNTNLKALLALSTGGIPLTSEQGSETNGVLVLLGCQIKPMYTFLDYIENGTQIHACFAIDFTSSNGEPNDSTSLHFFSDSQDFSKPNPYEQAIQAVGSIIQDYSATKLFPVYGFGARIPPNGAISHNFFVTLTTSPFCFGIPGVMEAYRNCIRQIKMYGPTCFSAIINHVASLAQKSRNGSDYYILLIITDGVITDMTNTKEAIVNASDLPISIIIVGVGGADYSAMEELDGDSVRISHKGKVASRDIVQFVPYRDAHTWMRSIQMGQGNISFKPPPKDEKEEEKKKKVNVVTYKQAQKYLAKEVLAEIPDQLTSYMKKLGIDPKKPSEGPSAKSSRSSAFN